MSRIRTTKPEFWTSEQVVTCTPLARLLFIGLWNFCDDAGIHPSSYLRLKMEVFPADEFTLDNIKQWIDQLINADLLREYSVAGQRYWQVTGWKKHQRIDKPTYRHPSPQTELKEVADNSANTLGGVADSSNNIMGAVDDASTTDRNGMDRNGEDKDTCEVKTSPLVVADPNHLNTAKIVFKHWQNVMSHPRARLDKMRQARIIQALKLGYTPEELIQAIDGCAKTPFNMGENDRRQRYDGIALILRNAENIERFIASSINPPSCSAKKYADTNNLMAGVI